MIHGGMGLQARYLLQASHSVIVRAMDVLTVESFMQSLTDIETPRRKLLKALPTARGSASAASSPMAIPRSTHRTNPAKVRDRAAARGLATWACSGVGALMMPSATMQCPWEW
ncbi:hypothetical protein [Luteimonas huabeiensis]|uniref:hypothetical protein n=1 Tax=Luteimonas huabeiensis TaxID=1244513 RepID=UPI001268A712|nr:hypothetical protein [Luteimonas huabeiensis]